MKRVDFPDLGALDVGSGGLVARDACLGWRVGEDGVRAIAALADDSVAFIAFGSRTLAVVAPGAGPVAIYPVPPLCRGRLTAVCLDLDGTLIDSEPLWIAVIERTIGEVTGIAGFRFAEGERRYVSGRSVGAHLAWALSAHAPGIGLDAARAVHARFTREALAQLASGGLAGDAPRLLPGFEALMATIRAHGLPVALVTSGVEAKMWPTLIAALGAAGLGAPSEQFDAILCGGASAADAPIGSLSDLPMKPHPWLYAEALSIGLGMSSTAAGVAVEDSAAGVVAARLAGLAVIGLSDGNIRDLGAATLCSKVVKNLDDVAAFIRDLAEDPTLERASSHERMP